MWLWRHGLRTPGLRNPLKQSHKRWKLTMTHRSIAGQWLKEWENLPGRSCLLSIHSRPPLWCCFTGFVCPPVCAGTYNKQLAVISQWAVTFVPIKQEFIFSFFFFFLTHLFRTHTNTEDLTQTECANPSSQLDTPFSKQWCFPLVPLAWGIIHWLIVFGLCSVLVLGSYSIILRRSLFYLSLSNLICFSPPLSLFPPFWRMRLVEALNHS